MTYFFMTYFFMTYEKLPTETSYELSIFEKLYRNLMGTASESHDVVRSLGIVR